MYVKPKKHLGQHFLKNPEICERIAAALSGFGGYTDILEIGPGTGALTSFLLKRSEFKTKVAEIDSESITYLNAFYPELRGHIIDKDFLGLPLNDMYTQQFAVVGNFPYNISSQILFKILDHKDLVPEVVGMFQKEVADARCGRAGKQRLRNTVCAHSGLLRCGVSLFRRRARIRSSAEGEKRRNPAHSKNRTITRL